MFICCKIRQEDIEGNTKNFTTLGLESKNVLITDKSEGKSFSWLKSGIMHKYEEMLF